MGGAKFPHRFEEAGQGRNESRVGGNRFDDDGGDFVLVLLEGKPQGFEIIKRQRNRKSRQRFGYTGTIRLAESKRAGAGFDQKGIDMPVVATFEFDDFVPASETA